jgi:hypothetical protein
VVLEEAVTEAIVEEVPPEADPWTRLNYLLRQRDVPYADLLEILRPLSDETGNLHQKKAIELMAWLTWLTEKQDLLGTLTDEQLAARLLQWQRNVDYYLWTDPAEVENLLSSDTEAPALTVEQRQHLVDRLRNEQSQFRELLASRGVQRIEAFEGSLFQVGQVERSQRPTRPTSNRDFHDKVYHIEPGEGGYRFGDRILMPSRARRYEYQSTASAAED